MPKHTSNHPRLQRRKRRTGDDTPLLARTARGRAGHVPGVDGPAHTTAVAQRDEALRELQATRGNAHVQRILARQAAPPTPSLWEDDHGLFHVFPDTTPLSLSMVDDPKQAFPLPETIAKKLRPVVDLIAGGAASFEFKGDADFKAALLMDLAWLFDKPAGRQLLDALLATGRKLSFEFAADGGQLEPASPTDAELRPDGALGKGTDVKLPYGPQPWSPAGGVPQWEQRKPAEALARSLVACLPLLAGTAPSTREREPVTNTLQATGDDRTARLLALENQARAAFGLPLRPAEP